jgi:hypothetical protein
MNKTKEIMKGGRTDSKEKHKQGHEQHVERRCIDLPRKLVSPSHSDTKPPETLQRAAIDFPTSTKPAVGSGNERGKSKAKKADAMVGG